MDGYINTATLKKRFEDSPLTECYAVRFKETDSYYMVIPVDGKRLILSTWRSEIAKPFRKADSLIKEAESFGFTSIKFGEHEENKIHDRGNLFSDGLRHLEFWISRFPSLGIRLSISRKDYDSGKIEAGIEDVALRSLSDEEREPYIARIKGNVHIED